METCKVTVILPSLNVADYIEECLMSVCQQTLKDIEIICVDAGSIDGTAQIIHKYALEDERIRVINSEKKSYGYQVNRGIREAKGQYIAILETDDYVEQDMYESLFKIAEATSCDYVKSNFRYYFTDSGGKRVFWNSDTLSKKEGCYEKIVSTHEMKDMNRYDGNIWSGIYNRDFIKMNAIECNESSGAAFQDIGFLQQVFWNADKAYYTKRTFYNYCTDRENSSTNRGNGLKYAYQEYQYLLSKEFQKISEYQNADCIYERMADVFEEELKKIISQSREEKNADIISWFIEILWQKQNEGIIFRTYLKDLVEDRDHWMDQYRKELLKKKLYKENMIHQLYGENVIIFGAGVRGKSIYQELDDNQLNVLGFCDNNQALWGKNVGCKSVYSLEEVGRRFVDAKYVIANKRNSNEMYAQLIGMGIKQSDIFIYGEM